MHQTEESYQWHYGIKAQTGMDADSGLVRAVVGTAAKVNDVTQACALVDCEENDAFVDTGYQSVAKQGLQANWYVAMRPRASARCWTRPRRHGSRAR